MCRLIELIVRSGLVTAWRFASCPTSRSPVFVNATTEGVVRDPSELAMTVGLCPSITATTEFVVPRSMPTTFAIGVCVSLSEQRGPSVTGSLPRTPSGLAAYRRSRDVSRCRLPGGGAALSYDAGADLFHSPGMTVFPAQWLRGNEEGRPSRSALVTGGPACRYGLPPPFCWFCR